MSARGHAALARLARPVFRRLFPQTAQDETAMGYLTANVAANLLGLGKAATPMGIAAVRRMRSAPAAPRATDEMCRLIVLNTASIQLLPTTVAAVPGGKRGRRAVRHPARRLAHVCVLRDGRAACGVPLREGEPCLTCSFRCCWPPWPLRRSLRRQDLYAALLEGGLDGLRLLVSIVPALVMLLTAVHLLRASGAVDLLTRWLTPAARVLGLAAAGAAACAASAGLRLCGAGCRRGPYGAVWRGFAHRPDGRRCAWQYGDDVLYHFRLFRRGRDPPHALCRARGAHRRPDGVSVAALTARFL